MRIRTVGLVIAGAAAIAGIAGGVAYATGSSAPLPNVPSAPVVQLDQPVQDQQPTPGEDCPFGRHGQATATTAEAL